MVIEGTPVQLLGRVPDFLIKIGGLQEVLPMNRLDTIKEYCIIGSEFLDRVIPITFDKHNLLFK